MPLYNGPGSGELVQQKNASVSVDTTTTSTNFVDLLTVSIDVSAAGYLSIIFDWSGDTSGSDANMFFTLLIDNVQVTSSCEHTGPASFASGALTYKAAVSSGSHTVEIRWKTYPAGTARIRPVTNPNSDHAFLLVREVTV